MKSSARAAAGRAAWAAKSPAEKARIRARLAKGRATAARGNLTGRETKVISRMLAPKRRKKTGSKRTSAPSTTRSSKAPVHGKAPSAKQLAARQAFAARAKAAAAERRAALVGSQARDNLSPSERKALSRLLTTSNRKRRKVSAKSFAKRNALRVASGKPPIKRRRRKARSNGTALARSNSGRFLPRGNGRKNARRNAYIAAAGGLRSNGKRRRRNGKTRRNGVGMYIRRNPGMEKVKTALILTGLGLGSFVLTNVAQHYAGQQDFAKGAIADYGVPAILAALVWLGPTGKLLAGNKHIGKSGQIALTAGIVGAVVNKALDGIITNNIAKIPSVGGHVSKFLLGWPIISEADLPVFGAAEAAPEAAPVGEYIYSPELGEYVPDSRMHAVGSEYGPGQRGMGYVDLEQRAANWAALDAASIAATEPNESNVRSQFDDQFDSAY